MTGLLARAVTVQHLTDDDQLRRARLLMTATAAMVVYLLGVVAAGIGGGTLAPTLVAIGLAVPTAATYAVARSGRLAAAEWMTAALVACSSVALISLHGTVAS